MTHLYLVSIILLHGVPSRLWSDPRAITYASYADPLTHRRYIISYTSTSITLRILPSRLTRIMSCCYVAIVITRSMSAASTGTGARSSTRAATSRKSRSLTRRRSRHYRTRPCANANARREIRSRSCTSTPLPKRQGDTGGDLRPLSFARNLHFFGTRRYYN